jgi:hypothetical protein
MSRNTMTPLNYALCIESWRAEGCIAEVHMGCYVGC